jgi:hypothetical protein
VLLDSSSISSAGWTQIAETIQNNYHLFDGFVVLHGTDSLAYTSSALSFMCCHLGKPIILTGSQASIFALQSDAVDNLLGSLIIAGTFMIPEVGLFFHHNLYRGNRTTKVSASSFDAFASPNCAPLAKVSAMGAEVNWNLIRRPRGIAKFDIMKNLDTAHVSPPLPPHFPAQTPMQTGRLPPHLPRHQARNARLGPPRARPARADPRDLRVRHRARRGGRRPDIHLPRGRCARHRDRQRVAVPVRQRVGAVRARHGAGQCGRGLRAGSDDGGGVDEVEFPAGHAGAGL